MTNYYVHGIKEIGEDEELAYLYDGPKGGCCCVWKPSLSTDQELIIFADYMTLHVYKRKGITQKIYRNAQPTIAEVYEYAGTREHL
jgi:hypothetical protein